MSRCAKILAMAFVGTHVPRIALSICHAPRAATTWGDVARSMGVTLAATFLGTAVRCSSSDRRPRPVAATSAALRRLREGRAGPTRPDGFGDEVGTPMAGAQRTMVELGASLRRLERFDRNRPA